ncbi:siderophore ABC transporter substrate-binding protein [Kurthia senegalensis]|uniref:siderophore ABC transporter substrate-binding protein n=1 Tax=Kurthia senegalensis TaxID=1033740 RepID=UPI000289B70F|nr:siderophore ABC transporter substrate-binding protein [Kurthia senegalensis]
MKKWRFLTATAALTLMLGACGTDESEKDSSGAKTEQTSDSKTAANADAFPMTVQSLSASRETEDGKKLTFEDVELKEQPKRIAVMDYGFLDTLDALGVEGVVAIPYGDGKGNLPAELKEKYKPSSDLQDVGNLKELNLEKVAAAEPDVIFISGRQAGYYEELKEITPNVIFIGSDNSDYLGGVEDSIDLAAKVFNKEDKAKELKATIDEKKKAIQEKAATYDNALVTMYSDKQISGFDNGEDSRFKYVYDSFGFKPAVTGIDTSAHGSNFSYEAILKANPEVLFVIDRNNMDVDALKKDVENDIIKKTDAYKNGKIVYLDGVNWYFSSNGATTEVEKMDEILNELK